MGGGCGEISAQGEDHRSWVDRTLAIGIQKEVAEICITFSYWMLTYKYTKE